MIPDNPKQLVGVHIGGHFTELAPELYHDGCWMGMRLVVRVWELALSHAGLLTGVVGAAGELKDCIIMAEVSDQGASVEVVKRELEKAGLLGISQIGVTHDGEWQCVYPSPEVRMAWLMDSDRLELEGQRFHKALENKQGLFGRTINYLRKKPSVQNGAQQ